MKTCAAPAAPKVNFNMKIHMTPGKALKAKIAAMTATKAKAAATPKIKFSMKIHLPVAAGKALKTEIAAKMATKAVAKKATKAIVKDIKKAIAKETKKAIVKDPKRGNVDDSKEDRNEAQGVMDLYIENLDLVKREPSNINTGVSSKAVSNIEKTFSNLSMGPSKDQV